MSMFKIFDVSGSAVSAQSQRLNVVASNLANADTVAGPDGKAYKARQVERGGGDGQHDLRIALLPEQYRSHEYRQNPAAEDAADGSVRH